MSCACCLEVLRESELINALYCSHCNLLFCDICNAEELELCGFCGIEEVACMKCTDKLNDHYDQCHAKDFMVCYTTEDDDNIYNDLITDQ